MGSHVLSDQTTSRKKRTAAFWRRFKKAVLLVLGVIWIFFIVTAPYSIDYFALSPIGVVIVLITAATVLAMMFELLRHLRLKHRGLNIVIPLFFVLAATHPQPTPMSGWDMFTDSLSMLWNPSAWQATFDVNLDRGISGITPLYFRTVVPNYPVTLIVIPNASSNTMEAVGLVSGHHIFSLEKPPAILNTIPNNSLWVNNVVFAIPRHTDVWQSSDALLSALQYGCGADCVSEIQFQVHPEYAAKMAINIASLAATWVKIPEKVSIHLNIVDEVAGLLLDPEWNTAVKTELYGTTTLAGSEFTWYSNSIQVYSGSILDGKWAIFESKQVVVSQNWDQAITNPPIPDLRTFDLPTFDPSTLDLPTFDPSTFDPVIPTPPTFDLPSFEQPNLTLPDFSTP